MLRAAFVAAAVAALTPAAAAAVTKVEAPRTGSVFITGSPANDHLAVSRGGRLVTVTRFALPAEPLLAGTGCSGDTGTVRCEMPAFGLDDLNYQDVGGNDVFRGNGYPQPLHLNGGPGADDLTGGLASDYIN